MTPKPLKRVLVEFSDGTSFEFSDFDSDDVSMILIDVTEETLDPSAEITIQERMTKYSEDESYQDFLGRPT